MRGRPCRALLITSLIQVSAGGEGLSSSVQTRVPPARFGPLAASWLRLRGAVVLFGTRSVVLRDGIARSPSRDASQRGVVRMATTTPLRIAARTTRLARRWTICSSALSRLQSNSDLNVQGSTISEPFAIRSLSMTRPLASSMPKTVTTSILLDLLRASLRLSDSLPIPALRSRCLPSPWRCRGRPHGTETDLELASPSGECEPTPKLLPEGK